MGLTILCKNWYNSVVEVAIYIVPARWQQVFFIGKLGEAHLGGLSKGHEVTSLGRLTF